MNLLTTTNSLSFLPTTHEHFDSALIPLSVPLQPHSSQAGSDPRGCLRCKVPRLHQLQTNLNLHQNNLNERKVNYHSWNIGIRSLKVRYNSSREEELEEKPSGINRIKVRDSLSINVGGIVKVWERYWEYTGATGGGGERDIKVGKCGE